MLASEVLPAVFDPSWVASRGLRGLFDLDLDLSPGDLGLG